MNGIGSFTSSISQMKSKKWVLKISVTAAVFCVFCFAGSQAVSRVEAADFTGKKISMIIPFKEGGGSSVHARFFVPLLEKQLPGNPTILIRNMDGGGSVKGINYFASHAKPDGMMVAGTGTGTFFKYVLGDKSVKYNLPEFIPFLNSPFGVIAYARSETGVKGPEDIKKLQNTNLIYGGSGPMAGDLPTLLSFDLLNIKFKTVFGLRLRSVGEAQVYLRTVRYEARRENQRLREFLGFEPPENFKLVPVKIVSLQQNVYPIAAVINKGSDDSLKVNQSVVNRLGLIGRIKEVMPDFATVSLLTDPANAVSGRIAESRQIGIVRYSPDKGMYLDNLPADADVNPGDLIISSGLGGVYPSG